MNNMDDHRDSQSKLAHEHFIIPALLALSTALAFAFLFPYLGKVPGLNGDEAWLGLTVSDILTGHHPLCGLRFYTGPLHYYFLAPFLQGFGRTVGVLRVFTAITSVISVGVYFLVLRRLFGAMSAALAVLLLVSSPWFVMYGRTAWAFLALAPVLSLTSLYFFLHALDGRGRARWRWMVLAVVTLALGVWNHLLLLTLPAVLLVFTLFFLRERQTRVITALYALAGGALGIIPHLWCGSIDSGSEWASFLYTSSVGFFSRVMEWPWLFLRIIQGDVLFLRFTGEVVSPGSIVNVLFFILAISYAFVRAWREGARKTAVYQSLLIGFISVFFVTLSVSPGNSERYFLLPLYFVPLILSLFFLGIMRRLRWQRSLWIIVGIFVAFNSMRIVRNYFMAYLASGGKSAQFYVGSMPETTYHVVRSQKLYSVLIDVGAKRIVTNFLIGMPLKFYDIEGKRFDAVDVRDGFPRGLVERLSPGTYAVTYPDQVHRDAVSAHPELELIFEEEDFLIYKAREF